MGRAGSWDHRRTLCRLPPWKLTGRETETISNVPPPYRDVDCTALDIPRRLRHLTYKNLCLNLNSETRIAASLVAHPLIILRAPAGKHRR